MYSSQSKKMDPPGPKQTNEVHNYVGNRTQSEYCASKKRALRISFLFVRKGTSEFSEWYTTDSKQIKGGHLMYKTEPSINKKMVENFFVSTVLWRSSRSRHYKIRFDSRKIYPSEQKWISALNLDSLTVALTYHP